MQGHIQDFFMSKYYPSLFSLLPFSSPYSESQRTNTSGISITPGKFLKFNMQHQTLKVHIAQVYANRVTFVQ